MFTDPLAARPLGAELRSVIATPTSVGGREALSVELTEEATEGVPGADYIDQPTFVLLTEELLTGVIDVDIRSGLREDAPEYARAFAGIAYRVTDESFEAVYVRPLNGASLNPAGPRAMRAVQYFAYPEWPFDRLREERPDGGFEGRADIRPEEWLHLRLEVGRTTLRASIDGTVVLDLPETLIAPRDGRIGLWVDIGTRAVFADLRIASGTA
ncbi:hypothetical protein [Rathayibacter caricis]|uniref:hypothetical protein n=1 Tax=Rathayibacter caricis TaxID=110936 RepID=UPI001FB2A121|nr:hypothetical protein [Rathayibacter caricis]